MKETEMLGLVLLRPQAEESFRRLPWQSPLPTQPITLCNLMTSTSAVYYEDANLTTSPPMVRPAIAPAALVEFSDLTISRSLEYAITRLSSGGIFISRWAKALPHLEGLATTLMRRTNGDQPVPLERHGVFVQHWDEKNPVPLTFNKHCSDPGCRFYGTSTKPQHELLKNSINVGLGSLGSPHATYHRNPLWKNPLATRKDTSDQVPDATHPLKSPAGEPETTLEVSGDDSDATVSAVGGMHTLLKVPSGADGALKVIPVLTQLCLPCSGSLDDATLALRADRAHEYAASKLDLQPGSYYVAVYVTSSLSPLSSTWKDSIPRGTIVIDAPSMERVNKPFGVDTEKLFRQLLCAD
ncbi:Hypothetical protein, putative [Bodo saltans]|uniref:Uncharacterized protein n=1 Tax=Bodo saltans TaxID=75058 RepID=A0A0S4J3I2_BODSA|nr:Hypothetical protein, putative [Bodo saltans]|eukprot:CUG74627.1 Hypothetical protein, putative [Bodo saltans]